MFILMFLFVLSLFSFLLSFFLVEEKDGSWQIDGWMDWSIDRWRQEAASKLVEEKNPQSSLSRSLSPSLSHFPSPRVYSYPITQTALYLSDNHQPAGKTSNLFFLLLLWLLFDKTEKKNEDVSSSIFRLLDLVVGIIIDHRYQRLYDDQHHSSSFSNDTGGTVHFLFYFIYVGTAICVFFFIVSEFIVIHLFGLFRQLEEQRRRINDQRT